MLDTRYLKQSDAWIAGVRVLFFKCSTSNKKRKNMCFVRFQCSVKKKVCVREVSDLNSAML